MAFAALGQRRLTAIVCLFIVLTACLIFDFVRTEYALSVIKVIRPPKPDIALPTPHYKPAPTYTPPPVRDPFPLLSHGPPPPIPSWNRPRKDLYKDYDLPVGPPLLIGFTRSWPILLQAVVSYITAGWPPDQIYVVENTGTHQSNARGLLSLQNPFHLNHTVLGVLGVNIVQTPVLLSFAQLQNFYLSLSYTHKWPYYFWSHMDVLALSYEDGFEGRTPKFSEPGYKTVYELGCQTLSEVRARSDRWGLTFFSYDHLALVNPAALEDVGGWDTLIPYYITDCDMHTRLTMKKWSQEDAKAGIVTDVSTTLDDLAALYRMPGVVPSFTDPNPPPPPPPPKDKDKRAEESNDTQLPDAQLEYWKALVRTADGMFHYKHGDRGRNTWQAAQRGGEGEPFYYDAAGLSQGIDIITEAGREVYRQKWGHRDCDLISGAGLNIDDQWRVEKDWN